MAAKVTFSIKIPALKREMSQGRNRFVIEQVAAPIIQEVVEDTIRELQEDFENHIITQEIEAGPLANNISNTLSGYGNLFSYIGFVRGSRPLAPIRQELQKKPKIRVKFIQDVFQISMLGPSLETIYDKTPLPWSTDSWARRIEVGIAGFGRYLTKSSNSSRSGEAIQINNKIRGGRFKNVSYMTRMFKEFYRKLGAK